MFVLKLYISSGGSIYKYKQINVKEIKSAFVKWLFGLVRVIINNPHSNELTNEKTDLPLNAYTKFLS